MRILILGSVLFLILMYSCQSHRFMQFGKKWNYETNLLVKPYDVKDTNNLKNVSQSKTINFAPKINEIESNDIVIFSKEKPENIKNEVINYKQEKIQLESEQSVNSLTFINESISFKKNTSNLSKLNTNLNNVKLTSPILIWFIIYLSLLLTGLFFYLHLVKGYSVTKSILIVLWQLIAFFIVGFLLTLSVIKLFESII